MRCNCGRCGAEIWSRARLPQCPVCQLVLCDACNHNGFCADDFEKLQPADQQLAKKYIAKIKTAFTVGYVTLGIMFLLQFIALLIGIAYPYEQYHATMGWLYTFLTIFYFTTFIPLICGACYRSSVVDENYANIAKMGKNYSEEFLKSPAIRYCPYCAKELQPRTKICANCKQPIRLA